MDGHIVATSKALSTSLYPALLWRMHVSSVLLVVRCSFLGRDTALALGSVQLSAAHGSDNIDRLLGVPKIEARFFYALEN